MSAFEQSRINRSTDFEALQLRKCRSGGARWEAVELAAGEDLIDIYAMYVGTYFDKSCAYTPITTLA